MKKLLVILWILSSLGCVKLTDKQEEAKGNPGTGSQRVAEGSEFQVVPLEKANSYAVVLHPPASANRVYRKNIQTSEVGAAISQDEMGVYRDSAVIAGTMYEYSFVREDGSGSHSISQIQVQVPKDFECNSTIELNSATAAEFANYNRIYLGAQAVIRNLGHTVKINTSEIHSEGATFETFVSGAQAPRLQHGRHGGYIQIIAKKAVGKIFVNMRGEHGNDSMLVPIPASPATRTASVRKIVPTVMPDNQMFLNAEELLEVDRLPVDDGTHGTRGGGSGMLSVYIEMAEDFILEATFEAGLKGRQGAHPQKPGFG